MKKGTILKLCRDNYKNFEEVIINEYYQQRGILNSEALLIVSIISYFKVNQIIESGRARGYSTKIIAKFFKNNPDIKIISIDIDKLSEDSKYSEKALSRYENVEILYGDSNKIIPEKINQDCIVFIDGPKGSDAINLAVKLLSDKRVKAVMLHDLHKNTFQRNVSEIIFNNYFFSDDNDFIQLFKDFDSDCWNKLKEFNIAPYFKDGKKMISYGGTLGVFFNSEKPINEIAYNNYLVDLEQRKPTLKNIFIENVSHESLFYKIVMKTYQFFNRK